MIDFKSLSRKPVAWGFSLALFISVFALTNQSFSRTPLQFIYSVITCLILDTVLSYYRKGCLAFPTTGVVSGFGIFFLLDSHNQELYLLFAALTIIAKHVFTINGRHIFNPTNFALLIGLLAFNDQASINGFRWTGSWQWSVLFVCLGLWVTYLAKRWALTLSYFAFFVLLAGIQAWVQDTSYLTTLLPVLGPSFHLYMFFMITDPKTTPPRIRDQIIFSFATASFEIILRSYEFVYAGLLSLTVVCLLWALVQNFYYPKLEPVKC